MWSDEKVVGVVVVLLIMYDKTILFVCVFSILAKKNGS